MSTTETNGTRIRPADRPGDLGWIVQAHGELYAAELDWDTGFEAMVARIVADFADSGSDREAGWIAELNGRRVGCILCVEDTDDSSGTVAKLRVLLVDPAARGHGIGQRLVDSCLDFARSVGYRTMTLWTVAGLDSARRIYQSRGFELIKEEPQHSFGHDVVGQTWTAELVPAPSG